MALPADVVARIDRVFVGEDRERACALLLELQASLGPGDHARVIRCVVHLAEGELTALEEAAAQARLDWRDVIMWAEYTPQGRRLRDFNEPLG